MVEFGVFQDGDDVPQEVDTHFFQVIFVEIQKHVHSDSVAMKNVCISGCICTGDPSFLEKLQPECCNSQMKIKMEFFVCRRMLSYQRMLLRPYFKEQVENYFAIKSFSEKELR